MRPILDLSSLPEPEPEAAEPSIAATRCVVAHLAFAERRRRTRRRSPKARSRASRVLEIGGTSDASVADASTARSGEMTGTLPDLARGEEQRRAPQRRIPIDSGEPVAIPEDVRLLWEEWTALVETLAMGQRRPGIKEAVYQQLYRALLGKLREPAGTDADHRRRRSTSEWTTIVAPWLSLSHIRANRPGGAPQPLDAMPRQLEERSRSHGENRSAGLGGSRS